MLAAIDRTHLRVVAVAAGLSLAGSGCWGESFSVAATEANAGGTAGSSGLVGPTGTTSGSVSVGGAQGTSASVGGNSGSVTGSATGTLTTTGAETATGSTGSVFGPNCREVRVPAFKDTFVWGMFPDAAHDFMALGDDRVEVSQYGSSSKRTLLFFDFSSGPEWQLVAGYLELSVVAADSYGTLNLHRLVTGEWEERTTTWLSYTSGQNWASPGGDFEPEPFASAEVNPSMVGGMAVWDVTPQAQAIHLGGENFGWVLKEAGEPELGGGLNFAFAGRETSREPEQGPTLLLHFCPTS